MSVFVRRTLTSGPPPDLAFGEVAYSDEDQVLHVGRADSEESPTAFAANPTDYGPAIALLNAASDSHADAIGLVATTISTQGDTIASLTTDVDALQIAQVSNEAIQGSQEGAIATLTTNVATLETSQGTQDSALAGLIIGVTALEANAFSGAYGDLSGKPAIPFGFTYDQTAEPTSPTAGQTWRERSGGGLIIGEWEWSGSLWLSLKEVLSSSTATNNISATNSIFDVSIVFNAAKNFGGLFITGYALTFWATDLVVNSTDDWLITVDVRGPNSAVSAVASLLVNQSLSAQVAGVIGSFLAYRYRSNLSQSIPLTFNTATMAPALIRVGLTRLNSAPQLNAVRSHIAYRCYR